MAPSKLKPILPPPPPAPAHRLQAAAVLADWAAGQNATDEQISNIVGMIDVEWMQLHPLPSGMFWPEEPLPANFRHRFRREVALILGWTGRRDEGHSAGFSKEVNALIRESLWPDIPAQSQAVPAMKEVVPASTQTAPTKGDDPTVLS